MDSKSCEGVLSQTRHMWIMQGDGAVSSETARVYDTKNCNVLNNRNKKCNYTDIVEVWSVLEAKIAI